MAHLVKFHACRPKRLFKATYVNEACPSSHQHRQKDTSRVPGDGDNGGKPSVALKARFLHRNGFLV